MKSLIHNVHIIIDDEKEVFGSLIIEDGKIKSIQSTSELMNDSTQFDEVIDGENQYLIPGLIDIHLHGSYGYDFIENPSLAINEVAKGLVSEGTTSFMASLTVISHQQMCDLLKEYQEVKQNPEDAHFLGIHSEGPYLSVEYKALMDETYLRDPSIQELDEMIKCSNGLLKIMTIAPEKQGMQTFIKHAIDNQITLMIGHTNTTCECAINALNQGVTGFTHLYNAMSPHTHRRPGAVTSSFLAPNAYCELITDGFHVHENVIASTYQILGSKQIVLVTDAMLAKGMKDGDYTFSGLRTRKTNQTVQVIETGRIAGSAITMIDAIKNMRAFTGCNIHDIVQMACINPAKVAKVYQSKGSLDIGKDADMILLDQDFNLKKTFIQGQCVFKH
ncbi:MAG: N-acetylglucosamine-6-phosphate deacetylase [Erysipelotrichaceae bacterium]